MNILVFSWRDTKHPLAGGAEQVVHQHAKGWISAEHSVTHFSSRFSGSKREEEVDGIKLIRGGYQYLGVQLAGFFYYLKNRNNFDVVVDEFHGLPFFTPLYVRKQKLAVIQETAGKVWFLNPLPKPLNWIIGLLGYLSEPLVFLIYRNVTFVTGSVSAKKDIVKFGIPERNIVVIPHGVLLSEKKISVKKNEIKTIVYLGILSKDKGIEDVLKSFFILNKKGKFNFWVIGKPETNNYRERIDKLIRKFNLERKIKFWGYVNQEKKFELLSRAQILVNPSVREGWGLVNIEANAVGTPVVAYNVAGIVDSVKNGVSGIICKRNNARELAENVVRILNDERLYKKLQTGSLSWSKRFSWDRSRKLSLNLIKRLSNAH